MNLWVLIILVSLILLFTTVFESKKLTPFFLTITGVIQILIGQYLLDLSSGTSYTWWIYFQSICALFAGYFFLKYILMKNRVNSIGKQEIKKQIFNAKNHFTHIIFITLVLVGVLYHFIVGGIPLFSSSIEVDRFSFSSSGLFGIPGRMYLFGLPFILIYTSYYHKETNNKFSYQLYLVVWGCFIVFKILSGFKGVIVDFVIFFIFIRAITNKSISVKKLFSTRFILVVVFAIIFAGAISRFYSSLSLNGYSETVQYLLARLTAMAAEPSYYVLNNLNYFDGNNVSFIYNEFLYFLNKYFFINFSNGGSVFPIDKIVSSALYNVPLSERNFIVPVTVGAFGGLVLDFGIVGSYLAMFFIGCIYYWLFHKCKSTALPFKGATVGLMLYELNVYVVNGGLIYLMVNVFVMIIGLGFLYLIAKIVSEIVVGATRKVQYISRQSMKL